MQEMHSKEAMLSMLSSRKVQDGYKRKKMKSTRSEPVSNASIIPSEMEVEDIEGIKTSRDNKSMKSDSTFINPFASFIVFLFLFKRYDFLSKNLDSLVETLPVNELFTPPLPKDTPPKPPEPPIATVLENSESQSQSSNSPDSTVKSQKDDLENS